MASPTITILDGPMGTELAARGEETPAPLWSAHALTEAPGVVAAIHMDYARAGATVHTTATFRTRRRTAGSGWQDLAWKAVELARHSVPPRHRVAGCIAPLEDCYRPDLSPEDPYPEHKEMAQALARMGVDLLLAETFPHVGEALAAVRACVETGMDTWVSFTAGPEANLLQPQDLLRGARAAVKLGAKAVLVNCVPATRTLPLIQPLADLGVPFGAYANAGPPEDGIGWGAGPDGPRRYADLAETWVEAGATLVGGCCGTGPAHIQELSRRFGQAATR